MLHHAPAVTADRQPMRSLQPFLACLAWAGVAFPAKADTIAVNFAKSAGRIRAIHGVCNGPVAYGENPDLKPWFKEAGFPTARLHDCHWPSPDVVDVSTIFPLSHLDPDDPRNYTFAKTDAYIQGLVDCGTKIVYRLGQSIEHGTAYHIQPPADMEKFARVCVNIVRHYNEGWADGFHHGIEYWEVWNEPEGKGMWRGTKEEFFTLYETVAKAIEAHDPKLKVGGPALTSSAFQKNGWGRPFLARCRDRKLPLDFFSFHAYTVDHVALCREARKALDEFGFEKTETHLNEWRYAPTWEGLRPRTPEMFATVPEWFRQGTNGRGGAFATSLLMRLQDERLDMANFYTADTSRWSMFGTFGIRTPVYHAFRAFNELAKRPRRVACTVSAATSAPADNALRANVAAVTEANPGGIGATRASQPPVAVAGLAEDDRSAVVLVSTFDAAAGPRQITVTGLPWATTARVEALLVDDDHALEPVAEAVADEGPARRFTIDIPADSTLLLRLTRP
jgi:hypothetical protein